MRKIYIIFLAVAFLGMLLFFSSFAVIDKEKHKTYYFTVEKDNVPLGSIRVDRYRTDERLIYRSVSTLSGTELYNRRDCRLTLTKGYVFESYSYTGEGNEAKEIIVMQRKGKSIYFLSRADARFSYLDDIPATEGTAVFQENSASTYLPIIENYDFNKGRSQGFGALKISPKIGLPPMKCYLTLTSIKDEYLKVGSRKIKTENLLIRMKNYPTGRIWVSKFDRTVIRIECPESGLVFMRAFDLQKPQITKPSTPTLDTGSRHVEFESKKTVLAGTLTLPKDGGIKYPAVLFACDNGPQDRQGQGLFSSMARRLAPAGVASFRFDKRGIGSSSGNYATYTPGEEIADLVSAFEWLSRQKEVDPEKLYIVGHGKGAYNAMKMAAQGVPARGLILMAPRLTFPPESSDRVSLTRQTALQDRWTADYADSVERMISETSDRVRNASHPWIYLLGKWCFTGSLKEDFAEDPMSVISRVKVPVLILQGKDDCGVTITQAAWVSKALSDVPNPATSLVFFNGVGNYFGKYVNDGARQAGYDPDGDVSGNIIRWLDQNNLTLNN